MYTHICISSPVCFLTEKQGGEGRGGTTLLAEIPNAIRATIKRSSEGVCIPDFRPLLFLLFSFLDHNPGSVSCKKQSEALARASAVLSVQRRQRQQQQQQRRGRGGEWEGGDQKHQTKQPCLLHSLPIEKSHSPGNLTSASAAGASSLSPPPPPPPRPRIQWLESNA